MLPINGVAIGTGERNEVRSDGMTPSCFFQFEYKQVSSPSLNIGAGSGVVRRSAPRSQRNKYCLFHPLKICLQKFKMKGDHVSFFFKDIRINKASWNSQSDTHKLKWVLFIIVDYEYCFFCLSPPFSSLIFLFFAFLTYAYIGTRHVSLNFLPCWFLISGKTTAWFFNGSLIPEDQTKKLRDVMAAYLLCRCKHLCVVKFRAVSTSLTKKGIDTA